MSHSDDHLLEADILSGISEYLLDQEDGAQFRIEQDDEEEAAFRLPPDYFPVCGGIFTGIIIAPV